MLVCCLGMYNLFFGYLYDMWLKVLCSDRAIYFKCLDRSNSYGYGRVTYLSMMPASTASEEATKGARGRRRLARRTSDAARVEKERSGRETVGRSLWAGDSTVSAMAMAMARGRRDMVAMAKEGRERRRG